MAERPLYLQLQDYSQMCQQLDFFVAGTLRIKACKVLPELHVYGQLLRLGVTNSRSKTLSQYFMQRSPSHAARIFQTLYWSLIPQCEMPPPNNQSTNLQSPSAAHNGSLSPRMSLSCPTDARWRRPGDCRPSSLDLTCVCAGARHEVGEDVLVRRAHAGSTLFFGEPLSKLWNRIT